MANIFISYASADRPRAKVLAEAIERHGWSIWWDRKISIGNVFDKEIEQALGASRCVIVLWSKASISSEWVREEADEGKRRGILAPILLEDVKIPMGFGRIQTANLADWQAGVPHPEFDQLLIAIARILQSQPTMQAKKTTGPASAEIKRDARDAAIAPPKPSSRPRFTPDKVHSTKPRSVGILDALKLYWPIVLTASAVLLAMMISFAPKTGVEGQDAPQLIDGATDEAEAAAVALRWVRISSNPRADLYLEQNGMKTGPYMTPYEFQAPFSEQVRLELTRAGYEAKTDEIKVQVRNNYEYTLHKAKE